MRQALAARLYVCEDARKPKIAAHVAAKRAGQLSVNSLVRMDCSARRHGPHLARQFYVQTDISTLTYGCCLVPATAVAIALIERAKHEALTRIRSLLRHAS